MCVSPDPIVFADGSEVAAVEVTCRFQDDVSGFAYATLDIAGREWLFLNWPANAGNSRIDFEHTYHLEIRRDQMVDGALPLGLDLTDVLGRTRYIGGEALAASRYWNVDCLEPWPAGVRDVVGIVGSGRTVFDEALEEDGEPAVDALTDGDEDGVPLLLEFAFGEDFEGSYWTATGDPRYDGYGLPVLWRDAAPPETVALTFVRRTDALGVSGVIYGPEISADLLHWEPFQGAETVEPIKPGLERVTLRAPVTEAGVLQYLRVAVSRR
jgi:hypothetical protein